MRRLLLLLAIAVAAPAVHAQSADRAPAYDGSPVLMQPTPAPAPARLGDNVLYDQAQFVTSTGTGPAGADESALQTALGLNVFGFGINNAASPAVYVADDFTVPAGQTWTVSEFYFYAYQTGSGTAPTITGYYIQLWDGPPGLPASSVIAGDRATNAHVGSVFSETYRTRDVDPPGGATTRPIMLSQVALTEPAELAAGTYWIEWSATGSGASGPWAVPVTILGETTTGNARQTTDGGTTWVDIIDSGTAATPQGLAFQVLGTSTGGTSTEGAPSSAARLVIGTNPVSASGRVTLTVGTSQDVRVALYDALGREVAVLFDRSVTAGQEAHIAFRTAGLAPGVYAVRATGTDLSLTERITVVR